MHNISKPSISQLVDMLDHFQRRVITDAFNEASASYWNSRADTFDKARPRPGEFHGNLTTEELSAKWCELTEIATACRARAQVALMDDPVPPELADVLQEVA